MTADVETGAHRPFRFAPPPVGPRVFPRPRLLARLGERWVKRVIIVEAGAGLGKTTLLSQAIAENRLDPRGRDVWLACEGTDSTESALLAGLLEGLEPGLRRSTDPPTVADLCNRVWSQAPDSVCFVLDDAHLIESGSPAERVLGELIDALPANASLVIAGRRIPALRHFARLVVTDRAANLTADDLCLTDDELNELARLHGIDRSLIDGAGGWPALAELRAVAGVAIGERFVGEEILGELGENDRHAFALIAAIGGADREIAVAIGGDGLDLDRMAAMPLVVRDPSGGLQPHALWAELLAPHLDGDEVLATRRMIGRLLATRRDFARAFDVLAQAAEWDEALDAVFWACNDQHRPPPPDVVARWASQVPGSHHGAPEYRYLRGYLARSVDPFSTDAVHTLQDAADGFRAAGKPVHEVTILVRLFWSVWLRRDAPALRAVEARARPILEGAQYPYNWREIDAIVANIEGNFCEERAIALDSLDVATEPRLMHFTPLHAAMADLGEGCVDDRTVELAERAAQLGAPIDPAAGSGWAKLLPAVANWARGALALARIDRFDDLGRNYSVAERVPLLAFETIRLAHTGDTQGALAMLLLLDDLVGASAPDVLVGFAAVARATVLVAQGDEDGARAQLRGSLGPLALERSGAGRAILWFPSIPCLLDRRCRDMVDAVGNGPSRAQALSVVDALIAARSGGTEPAAVPELDVLLSVLPPRVAIELVVRTAEAGSGRNVDRLAELGDRFPELTRALLTELAETGAASTRKPMRALLASVRLPPSAFIRIEVLGPTRLLRDGHEIDDANWRRERVRQLLCAMVAHHDIRRGRLGALLWPEADEAAVSANLRMTLTYVQALMEPDRARGAAPWFIHQRAGVLRLDGGPYLSVDAWDVDGALRAADDARRSATPSAELALLRPALQRWRGEYLEDLGPFEWANSLRQELQARFVRGAIRAGELLIASGDAVAALDAARCAQSADRWSEGAHQLRVRANLALRDRSGARRAYDELIALLSELGIGPDPATLELGRDLR